MNCARCQGVMREDQFFDCEGTDGLMWMRGWRCVDCSHAVDPLIDANRRLNALTHLALPHIWRSTGLDGVCVAQSAWGMLVQPDRDQRAPFTGERSRGASQVLRQDGRSSAQPGQPGTD